MSAFKPSGQPNTSETTSGFTFALVFLPFAHAGEPTINTKTTTHEPIIRIRIPDLRCARRNQRGYPQRHVVSRSATRRRCRRAGGTGRRPARNPILATSPPANRHRKREPEREGQRKIRRRVRFA